MTEALMIDGGYEHVFEPARGDDPRTLVLLHGTGGDERAFMQLGRMVAPEAARLSLRGDVDEHGMARFFRRLREGVYDMDDLARATEKLDRFLEEALPALGRDPAHAIGLGYSNGANMLANLLFERPNRLRRMALFHPLIPWDAPDDPDIAHAKVLITAGERDPICPPDLTRRFDAQLRAAGADVELLWHEGGHELREDEIRAARVFAS
ncbi:MAG: alpha/beta hydrolase [Neomegalonema sp.]